jgi:hypothetical protein
LGLKLSLEVISRVSLIFNFPVFSDVIDAILAVCDSPSNVQFISNEEIIPPCGIPLLVSLGFVMILWISLGNIN